MVGVVFGDGSVVSVMRYSVGDGVWSQCEIVVRGCGLSGMAVMHTEEGALCGISPP